MNTPVSFEIAKLLKEKGFPLKNTGYAYNKNGELVDPCFSIWECEAPTIAEVVMWIYEKHGIWVSVNYGKGSQTWGYIICENENKENRHFGFDKLNQAYEAAIEYCLNKLI